MEFSHALYQRPCPLCKSTDTSRVIFNTNLDEKKLDKLAFSSRKFPEFMNLKLVNCPTCELLYAPFAPTQAFLESAYQDSGYESQEEAKLAAESYAAWLKVLHPYLPDHASALEVGAGNGAFLAYLLAEGFQEVVGVEPSTEAIAAAAPAIQKHLQPGFFDAANYRENHFSLIAIFQTLEHLERPEKFLAAAFRLLKAGGILMIVAHNYRHWLMRLLGKRAPIVDLEHLQLFSRESLRFSLEKSGFRHVRIEALRNCYPLHYWLKLSPLPEKLKKPLYHFLKSGRGRSLGALKLKLQVGNMIAWAKK